MRYLGCGWPEAHHPWSKGKKVYSPVELLEHLVEKVIPIKKTPPKEAPFNLPCRRDYGGIGDDSVDKIALDNNKTAEEQRIRLQGMKERDRLESLGFGCQLMEMQRPTAPLDEIRSGSFRIDMCFEYTDEGESILQWCQGKVTKLVKEYDYHIVVEVRWDDEYVKTGESKKTKEKLKKSDWNPEEHVNRSWRQDLLHLVKTAEDL